MKSGSTRTEVKVYWGDHLLDLRSFSPGETLCIKGGPDLEEASGGKSRFEMGGLVYCIRQVRPVRGVVSSWREQLETRYANALLVVAFLAAGLLATFHLRPGRVEASVEDMHKVPDRYVQFLLERPAPKAMPLLNMNLNDGQNLPSKAAAARHKGVEGKAGQKNLPDMGKRSARRARDPNDPNKLRSKGLLAVLNNAGTGPAAGLPSMGTGLGGELEDAMGGIVGYAPGPSGGMNGAGLKGFGPGGGGIMDTIGTGPLDTHGRAGGHDDYGRVRRPSRTRAERDITINVDTLRVVGPLSRELIRRVIREHRDQIRYCYNLALNGSPNLSGKLQVQFVIGDRGYVEQARILKSNLGKASLERCVVSRVRTWRFPKPNGGGRVQVNYPFLFRHQGK